MRDLNYDLMQLCRRNRDGSYATQADRQHILDLVADQLHKMGFRRMNAHSLKPKHVDKLVERSLAENLSVGTIKNRMTALRWLGGEDRQREHHRPHQRHVRHRDRDHSVMGGSWPFTRAQGFLVQGRARARFPSGRLTSGNSSIKPRPWRRERASWRRAIPRIATIFGGYDLATLKKQKESTFRLTP